MFSNLYKRTIFLLGEIAVHREPPVRQTPNKSISLVLCKCDRHRHDDGNDDDDKNYGYRAISSRAAAEVVEGAAEVLLLLPAFWRETTTATIMTMTMTMATKRADAVH